MNDIEADLLIANAKIKQLEQELADMTAQRDALKISNDGLCFSHQTVSEQLAESQRRERAAVEDLLKDSHCTLCKHHLSEGGDCYGVSKCAVNGLRVGWEWRGPVAGEGAGAMNCDASDKCVTCAHNRDKSNLDCDMLCEGVSLTNGYGVVLECDDYKKEETVHD